MREEYDFSTARTGVYARDYAGLVPATGRGAYGVAEAARLAGLRPGTVRDWMARVRGASGATGTGQANPQALSFLDLTDLLVMADLRDVGLAPQAVRALHEALGEALATLRPFARQELAVPPWRALLAAAEATGASMDVHRRRRDRPLLPRAARLEYDPRTRMAIRWSAAEGVVVDPERSFGRPLVAASGVATDVLAAAYEASGRDAKLVAAWYGVPADSVQCAVAFEGALGRRAA